MPVLPNVLIWTTRSSYTPATGVTSAATNAVQTGIVAHIRPMTGSAYKILPEAALESDYVATADTGADIREGDILSTITLMDGVTPWPGLGLATNTNETWRVTFVSEATPGPLAHRNVYIKRERGGGPSY